MTTQEFIELRQRLEAFAKKAGKAFGSNEDSQKLAEVCVWIGAKWMANALDIKGLIEKGGNQ